MPIDYGLLWELRTRPDYTPEQEEANRLELTRLSHFFTHYTNSLVWWMQSPAWTIPNPDKSRPSPVSGEIPWK